MDIKIHYDNKEQCYDFAPIPCRENEMAAGDGIAIEVVELPEPTKDIVGKVYYNTSDNIYYVGEKHSNYPNGFGYKNINTTDMILDGTVTAVISNTRFVQNYVYKGCTNLTSIDLPEAWYIGEQVFEGCTALTNVNVPNLTDSGYGIFRNCTALKHVYLPKYTGTLSGTFDGCTSLETVTFGSPIPPDIQTMYTGICTTSLKAIYVPAESVEAYKNGPGDWGYTLYKYIQPIPEQ